MKKYLSLVLAALMAVMCISLPAFADEERPVITIMNRVNAEILVIADHKGSDIERGAFGMGNPVLLKLNESVKNLESEIFVNLRKAETLC